MSRIASLAAAMALAVGLSAFGGGSGAALALPKFSPSVASAPPVEQVRHRDRHRHRFHPRRHHRYYHRNPVVHFELWFGPAPRHTFGRYDWRVACSHKYRSFNWRTGRYRGYDGRWHRCRLP